MRVHESDRQAPTSSAAPSQIELLLSRFQRPARTAQPGENPPDGLTTGYRAGETASRSCSTPGTAPVDALNLLPDLAAGGLPARVRAPVSAYPHGAPLPPARDLAHELDRGVAPVAKALAALEASGEIATSRGRRHRYRLQPDELHSQDVAFDRADVLDVERPDEAHFAFGHGVHYCIGAPLARSEGAIGLSSLITTSVADRHAARTRHGQ